jgi:hypothetical protein
VKLQRRPLVLRIGAVVVVGAVTAGAVLLANRPVPANSPPPPLGPVMQGSQSGTDAVWATVNMGKPTGGFNFFWQLFELPSGKSNWRLVTPPGVASNGGLVVSPSPGPSHLAAAFGASQDLVFSPVAVTGDGGKRWIPGILPGSVATTPGALATAPSGATYALLTTPTVELVKRTSSWSSWRAVVTLAALQQTAAGRACQLTGLTAVSVAPDGALVLGGSCANPSVVPLFVQHAGSWDAPLLNLGVSAGTTRVLSLSASTALFSVDSGTHRSIVVGQTSQAAAFAPAVVAAPLAVTPGESLLATGSGAHGAWFVVSQSGARITGAVTSGPARPWRTLPTLPAHTATLALTPTGQIDALTALGRRFSAWRLESNGEWREFQSLLVPLAYGSSD